MAFLSLMILAMLVMPMTILPDVHAIKPANMVS